MSTDQCMKQQHNNAATVEKNDVEYQGVRISYIETNTTADVLIEKR